MKIKVASKAASSATQDKLPTFDPSWLMGGDTVPADTFAIMLPKAMFAAFETGAIVASKGGAGKSATACRLSALPALTIPRADGTEVDVNVPVSCYTAAAKAAPATDPLTRIEALRAALEAAEAAL